MIKLLLILEALFALGMGAVVFINSPYSKLHRTYGLVSIFSSVWLVANALSINEKSQTVLLAAGRLITPSSLLTTFCLLLFIRLLIKRPFSTYKLFLLLLIPNLLISILSFTSLNAYIGSDQQLHVGSLFPFFVVVLLINVLASLYLMFRSLPPSTDVTVRSQLMFMRFGLALSVIPAALFGALLPLFNYSSLSDASPLFAIIFLLLTAISIVRHNLFDIRAVVARAVAYLALIGTLSALYALIVVVIISKIFGSGSLSKNEQVAYLIASLVIGFTFSPLKRFFDGWSRKVFYRDLYQPQQLLDDLNRELVRDIDLSSIVQKSALIIGQNINADFVIFGILAENGKSLRLFGNRHMDLTVDELRLLRNSFKGHHKVISLSDLADKTLIFNTLKSHSIMAAGELSTKTNHMGYIFIGEKKSGNLYSKQDLQVLQLISDELAIAIQNSLHFEEIQRFNTTLQEKIEEATKQLRHANQRLKELDQTKDEFISMASHQLRTPLTTIKGYLSMVLEGDVGPVTKNERKMIQQAFDSAERMVFLIADLLNVSRLQSGKFVIENNPTDLAKMVETEVAQLKETAENHHLTLIYKKPEKFPTLDIDENKIRQVVMNFMDNAIYYTPAGGSIEVALETTDDTVSYTVTDTGLGVPKAEQHHLFSKFYRAGNARKMRPDGTGLGLFMAKKVIVAQGGAIIFKSTEGKGSTFGFSFPRKTVETRGEAPKEKPGKETPEPAAALATK